MTCSLLIYVVFRATRYECLSVSNISELSSRRFSELLLLGLTAGCVLTGQSKSRMSGDSAFLSLAYDEVAALSTGVPIWQRALAGRVGGGFQLRVHGLKAPKLLIYVVFRATLYECLSVSLKIWRSQVEDFRSYFFRNCRLCAYGALIRG